MQTDFECVPCMLKSLINLFNQNFIEKKQQEKVFKEVLKYYSEIDYTETPLLVNRNLHKKIREISQNPDPYKVLKDKFNNVALELYEQYKEKILNATNPLDKALRFAISGNIIDFGPGHTVNVEENIEHLFKTNFAINHSEKLFEELGKAKSILYLADNTGEIVFDKLFLEVLSHDNVTLAVRHSPILNDATMEDIKYIGLDKVVKRVITNGDISPGTLLTHVSDEFLDIFNSVDLIISKGQGNFEGLNTVKDKNIFFLLMVKCHIIADIAKVKKGDCIVKSALIN